jgi:hypothetical protein
MSSAEDRDLRDSETMSKRKPALASMDGEECQDGCFGHLPFACMDQTRESAGRFC